VSRALAATDGELLPDRPKGAPDAGAATVGAAAERFARLALAQAVMRRLRVSDDDTRCQRHGVPCRKPIPQRDTSQKWLVVGAGERRSTTVACARSERRVKRARSRESSSPRCAVAERAGRSVGLVAISARRGRAKYDIRTWRVIHPLACPSREKDIIHRRCDVVCLTELVAAYRQTAALSALAIVSKSRSPVAATHPPDAESVPRRAGTLPEASLPDCSVARAAAARSATTVET